MKKTLILLGVVSVWASALQAAPLAYVPNEKDGTVSVIDTQTDKVVNLMPAKGVFGKKNSSSSNSPKRQKIVRGGA